MSAKRYQTEVAMGIFKRVGYKQLEELWSETFQKDVTWFARN